MAIKYRHQEERVWLQLILDKHIVDFLKIGINEVGFKGQNFC